MNQRILRTLLLSAIVLTLAAACQRGADNIGTSSADTKLVATVVDSALPRKVELERFRVGLGAAASELINAYPSRDSVVSAFLAALRSRDTAQLAGMALTKSEFAWIYYPDSPLGKPPYDLSPGLMFFQFEGNSRKGLFHALEERGGTNLNVSGYACALETKQGENTVWAQCMLHRVLASSDTVAELLFGGIIERKGRFKILNFANKL